MDSWLDEETERWMDGWVGRQTNRRITRQTDHGRKDRWVFGCAAEWLGWWVNGWEMGEYVEGQTAGCVG